MNPQITPATVAARLGAAGSTTAGSTPTDPTVTDSNVAGSTAGGPTGPASGVAPADAIAEAMAGLSRLENAPTRAHVGAFERVHVALTDALAAIDGV